MYVVFFFVLFSVCIPCESNVVNPPVAAGPHRCLQTCVANQNGPVPAPDPQTRSGGRKELPFNREKPLSRTGLTSYG